MSMHLQNSYAIRDGYIDPWGTICILMNGVDEPSFDEEKPFILQPGLPVYSEKLVWYGKGEYRVHVANDTVEVLDDNGVTVEEIPHTDFVAVEISEYLVHNSGYLEHIFFHDGTHQSYLETRRTALAQAASGDRPCYLDNSEFVQVDKSFAGQKLVALECGLSEDKKVFIFTQNGEQVSCEVRYPLSFAKWAPDSQFAQYGVVE